MAALTSRAELENIDRVRVKDLDVLIVVRETKERLKGLRALGKEADDGFARPQVQGRLFEVALLPKSSRQPYYIVAHVDRETIKDKRYLTCSLHHWLKPRSNPPAPLEALRKSNKTVEWLIERLRELFGEDKAVMIVNSEISLEGWEAKSAHIFAPPLTSEANVLENSGAEYRAKDGAMGVQSFRWSKRAPEQFDVWMSVLRRIEWPKNGFWEGERDVCLRYIDELL